jgi:hypothetical protein
MSTTQNAAVAVNYAPVPGFPAGSAVDHILVTATASNPANSPAPQSVAPDTSEVTFANLAPDTYVFTAQAMPATGAGFGSPVASAPLTIVAPATVSLSLPQAVSASQP